MHKELAFFMVLVIGLAGVSALSCYVQPVKALYNVVEIDINPDGSVTPSDAPINNINNTFYTMTDDINITAHPGYSAAGIRIKRSNIIFNGNGHILKGHEGGGFWLAGVSNVTIENSTATGFSCCIYFESASGNVVKGNTFYGFGVGAVVNLWTSGNNTFDGNIITNGGDGVWMAYAGPNNTFTRNYIANNTGRAIGWQLGGGGARFYRNVIGGSSFAAMYAPACTWDNGYPSGGNYWIGYASSDNCSGPYQNITGSDGIGDTPYVIDADDIDHYPFMMIDICNVSQTPSKDNVTSTDVVEVNATVTHYFPLEQVILNCSYTNSSATWTSIINMTNHEGDIWNGIIPSLPVGTNVTYVITAQDNSGNSINSTSQGYTFDYPVVIPEFPSFLILPLFFIATLLVVIVYRRKRARTDFSKARMAYIVQIKQTQKGDKTNKHENYCSIPCARLVLVTSI
jgi:parallel beta-helix repeat protein